MDLHLKALERSQSQLYNKVEVSQDIVNSKYFLDPLELLGERSFKEPKEIPEDVRGTDIQEFFHGKNVLITGSTGFMGKVLTEKLLRSMPHIKKLYLLIRTKKGKDVTSRMNEIFEDRLFKRLKAEKPNYQQKVSVVAGDCCLSDLGLTPSDYQMLQKEVNILFHGAATVRFDEKIRLAVDINVYGAKEVLNFAKGCKNLQSMVHVSTAFANCNKLYIEEKFYEAPIRYENLLRLTKTKDDDELDKMTPELIADWPNTYTFTKALGEQVVNTEGGGLPISVFRPAVVISSYKEPVRGWIDNVYGPTGLLVGAGTGVLHTYLGDQTHITDMVPVDLATNALIAAAYKTGKSGVVEKGDDIPIYNYVSSVQNPISWKEFIKLNYKHGIHWPTIRAVWYYSFTPIENPYFFVMVNFLLHTLPGYILDFLAIICGEPPMLTKIYKKLGKFADTMTYFSTRVWTFRNDRVQDLWASLSPEDQEEFFFDLGQMNWEYHAQANCLGLRVYLVKDDIHTLPAARRKWQRLYYAHCALRIVCAIIIAKLSWMVLNFFFKNLL
ncbi:fatty acyl-CoA reductase wat-like [Lycorma delicatula]|uniref:fatty acyl-CoA reductase wat-like n=1 Tax=Lycorma delicatula TaxID=130591 RepID=UPI003F5146F5